MQNLAVVLANLYVEKYLYKELEGFDDMYKEIIVPFLELDDSAKSTFLSYITGRISTKIKNLNEELKEAKDNE